MDLVHLTVAEFSKAILKARRIRTKDSENFSNFLRQCLSAGRPSPFEMQ
ncbi:hypothetical protein BF49_0781 [Bradyrhizobium sp.]|nr:hypothetical protein BF49_0781 [Bradyrhizobium sp.]